jgi:hypothetical protein
MPAILIAIGALFIVAAARNTVGQLGTQLGSDFSAKLGGVSFATWAAAIAVIGAAGYVEVLRTPSRWLLALVALVVILQTQGGIFTKLASELSSVPQSAAAPAAVPANLPAIPVSSSSSSSSSSSGGSGSSTASTVATVAEVAAIAV